MLIQSAALGVVGVHAQSSAPVPDAARATLRDSLAAVMRDSVRTLLRRDVAYLASDLLGGRETGRPGVDSAAAYLIRRYEGMQIAAASPVVVCDTLRVCARNYVQTFQLPPALLREADLDSSVRARNIISSVPGSDARLAGQWIVIGAHYDHIGRSGIGSLDRDHVAWLHPGADDNASGTAAVMELARRFAEVPSKRPILFVHFGAEELGLVGSAVFVQNAPVPLDSMVAMFNFDMVGRLRNDQLEVFGLETSRDWRKTLDDANTRPPLRLSKRLADAPSGNASDHMSFSVAGVPAVHLFTGDHPEYHTRLDTPALVNIEGLRRVIDYAERAIRSVGDAERPLRRNRSGRR